MGWSAVVAVTCRWTASAGPELTAEEAPPWMRSNTGTLRRALSARHQNAIWLRDYEMARSSQNSILLSEHSHLHAAWSRCWRRSRSTNALLADFHSQHYLGRKVRGGRASMALAHPDPCRASGLAGRTGWVSYSTAVSRIAEPHARFSCQDRYS